MSQSVCVCVHCLHSHMFSAAEPLRGRALGSIELQPGGAERRDERLLVLHHHHPSSTTTTRPPPPPVLHHCLFLLHRPSSPTARPPPPPVSPPLFAAGRMQTDGGISSRPPPKVSPPPNFICLDLPHPPSPSAPLANIISCLPPHRRTLGVECVSLGPSSRGLLISSAWVSLTPSLSTK